MAKNITLLGASYSDVPAVNLPQTGGGTARFDDVSVTTATASDVAQGKVFVASDGTVTTGTASGGGGVDIPTFTIVWDDNYEYIVSASCDKTYSEVLQMAINDILFASVNETNQSETETMQAYATFVGGTETALIYCEFTPGNVPPSRDITISSNNTVTVALQSAFAEELFAATNGQYVQANGGVYTSVYVDVPQPSGTINITQNGTVDVTNYASAVVNVSGGGASNFVTGTFTTPSTTSTNGTVDVPYTGTGYPLALVIYVEGGAYNSAVSGWYDSLVRYAVGQFIITKGVATTAPSYGTSGSANYGTVQSLFKNSTSSATSYSSTRSATANSYSSSDASGTATTCVRWRSNTRISYRTAGGTSTTYGLLADTTYRYYAVYSE